MSPFDSAEARAVLREQLGAGDINQTFDSISEEPLASMSIGQVYCGTLRDKMDVAIKVQRPDSHCQRAR